MNRSILIDPTAQGGDAPAPVEGGHDADYERAHPVDPGGLPRAEDHPSDWFWRCSISSASSLSSIG